jgi:N-acetylneuraminate synthase
MDLASESAQQLIRHCTTGSFAALTQRRSYLYMEFIEITGRRIGSNESPYIIAEIGANHNGDMALCKETIDAAKECGVDAVKFQSWSKASLISKAEYARNTRYSASNAPTLEQAVTRYQLTAEQHIEVADYCKKVGVVFFSSCFSREEVDLLDSLDVPAYKVASMDVNHLPLLEYVGSKKKPVILSTGLATLGEIETAVKTLSDAGAEHVSLLHCLSIYPSPPEICNLRNMETLRTAFQLPVGYSDHSVGIAIPLAAIALGACVIEKHFTLSKALEGWDHALSADPAEMGQLVREARNVFDALGTTCRTISASQLEKRKQFRRRLVLKRSLRAGERITIDDVEFKRPGTGIRPDELAYVLGRAVNRDLEAEEELEWVDLHEKVAVAHT